jgi:c-di-GMP-binding flagellar brake protein YcgR
MVSDNRFAERRQFTRIPARFVVMMKLDIKNLGDYAIDTEIINISEGGMLLELRDIQSSETGTQHEKIAAFYSNLQLHEQLLWLQFRLPDNPMVIQTIAKPVWKEIPTGSKGEVYLLGIQYTRLFPEAQQAISRFITGQLKQGS